MRGSAALGVAVILVSGCTSSPPPPLSTPATTASVPTPTPPVALPERPPPSISGAPSPRTAPPSPSISALSPSARPSPPPASQEATPPPVAPVALPCPERYIAPDSSRPVLDAALTVKRGGVLQGAQRLVFTPDLPTGEIVLRLWAANPRARRAGGSFTLEEVRVNGVARRLSQRSPTLVRIPLAGRTPAGTPIVIETRFRAQLPRGANDRVGYVEDTAWMGSVLPLLSWVRGSGWTDDPETTQFAEAATSEAMELGSLRVTRDPGSSVIATGVLVSDDGRTAEYRARAVRDVAVAVGRFRTAKARSGEKEILVGAAPQVRDDPAQVAAEMRRSLAVHARRLGPFPYEQLSVAVIPGLRGGVEYPGMILLGTGQAQGDATGSHEVAHEWFYGLVGANQARDPWLDEAFATYLEAVDRGTGSTYAGRSVPREGRNRVGEPMTYWEGRSSYFRSVYTQGAAMLLEARDSAGAGAFDEALRCHVRRNAHRVTTPADLAASFRHLPEVLQTLERYGAL